MSLSLLLFRHAESGMLANSDLERVLTEKGRQQALFMGELITEKSLQPDLIICSSAARARLTMELALESGQWHSDINITDVLYETTAGNVYELIKHFSNDDRVVMLVGHEPTWSELATVLTGSQVNFKPAGICHIEFKFEQWADVRPANGQLRWYEHP